MKLEYRTYDEAKRNFTYKEGLEVFDRGRDSFNIAYECIDRHPGEKTAIRLKFDDGRMETHTFAELSGLTSQFANMLEDRGINKGDRVAIILFPSLEFYVSFFGTLKRGAVVVPCLPLFGPEAIEFRIKHSQAKMVITSQDKVEQVNKDQVEYIVAVEGLRDILKSFDDHYETSTDAKTLAVIQFSSGTTGSPKPVYYNHIAATLTAVSMKLCIGLRDSDEYFCPSSPAWGHGIWYGTVGPLIFGKAIGAYSGKFNVEVLMEALEQFEITNMSATPLVYRSMSNSGEMDKYKLKLRRMTFTGGALDLDNLQEFQRKLGIAPKSFYGSTEVGVIVLHYDFEDDVTKLGSMGKAMLGVKVSVMHEDGSELPPGQLGQMAVWRKDHWVKVGDLAYVDEEGYFWHKGRTDDVIISAGYTIGPLEIEEVLEKHPAVVRAAVVGSPDEERGEVVKAFIVLNCDSNENLAWEIKDFVKTRLSMHEYPREIEFVSELPETPDGKIKRKELKQVEYQKKLKK